MHARVPSGYTWAIFGSALLITALGAAVVLTGVGGEQAAVAASDIQEMLVVGLAAAAILRVASHLGSSTSVGRPWLLIGLGAGLYAIGDTIWTVIEVAMGQEVPYPGVPDLFYLAEYPLFAVGIIGAGMAYRQLVQVKRPAVLAGVAGVIMTAAIFVGLLWPTVIQPTDITVPEKVVSTLYPVGDVLLMVTPALFVILVLRQLGGGRLSWPWFAVAAGTVVIAISDSLYAWLSAYDMYASGNPVDFGWSVGHALVMLGALIAWDLSRPVPRPDSAS